MFGQDPDGNLRTVPVRLDNGVVIWHSPQEYTRLWSGVDREACQLMEDSNA
jgi:hypothetical protein